MKRLIAHGFVTKHRHSKLIDTPQGERRVQDSNAYEIHLPNAGLAIVPVVANKVAASGSDNPGGGQGSPWAFVCRARQNNATSESRRRFAEAIQG
jgi:hypothetical protein